MSNVEIRLTRGVCFGFCPDYTVTINGDGQVRYEGRRFVNAVGERTATIPREDVARLVARFDEIGFDRLRDAYRAQVTDLPTYTVALTRNGRTKTVVDYGGTGAGMPESRARPAGRDRPCGGNRPMGAARRPAGARPATALRPSQPRSTAP